MWMRLEGNLLNHRKLKRLCHVMSRHVTKCHAMSQDSAKEGVTRCEMLGHIVTLWLSVLNECPDGSLEGCDPLDIALMADWNGDADLFVDALCESGFLDKKEGQYLVHDWDEYAEKLKARARKQASRERQRATRSQETVDKTNKSHDVTDCHVMSQNVTPDETRRDETRRDQKTNVLLPQAASEDRLSDEDNEEHVKQKEAPVQRVVDFYLQRLETHRKQNSNWNGRLPSITSRYKVWRKIKDHLKAGESVESLQDAIRGMFVTPHNLGDNERNTEYLGLHIAMKPENLERFQAAAKHPPTRGAGNTRVGVAAPEQHFDEGEIDVSNI